MVLLIPGGALHLRGDASASLSAHPAFMHVCVYVGGGSCCCSPKGLRATKNIITRAQTPIKKQVIDVHSCERARGDV